MRESLFEQREEFFQVTAGPWARRLAASWQRGAELAQQFSFHQSPEHIADRPPAEPIVHTRASEISDLVVTYTQPTSLEGLAALHNLNHLRFRSIDYVTPQVKFVSYLCSSQHNLILEAPTGTGKTFISLMCADHYISKGRQVIVLTPSEHLTKQFERDSKIVLDLPKESVLMATGDMTPAERARAYEDQNTKLIIATPETILNDLLTGRLNVENVGLVVIDEMHLMVGDYAAARLGKIFADLDKRILAQSATPNAADAAKPGLSPDQILENLSSFNAKDYVAISIPPNRCYNSIEFVDLADKHQKGREKLSEVGTEVVRELWSELLILADSYAESGSLYGPIENFMVELGNACSKGGKETLRRFLERRRGLFSPVEIESKNKPKQPQEKKRPFHMPTSGDLKDLLNGLASLSDHGSRREFFHARELLWQLGALRHVDNLLATEGLQAFLSVTAEHYAKAHFTDAPRKDSAWKKQLYRRPGLVEAIKIVAEDTVYKGFLEQTSWQAVGMNLLGAVPGEDMDPEIFIQAFDTTAFWSMIRYPKDNHPAERSLLMWITGDPRVTGNDGIHIRVKHAAQAYFLEKRLAFLLSDRKVEFSPALLLGKKHMSSAERTENLEGYEGRKLPVLIASSAGDLGLDMKRTRLVLCLASPHDPNTNLQLQGRAGRRKDLRKTSFTSGSFIIIATRGTEDETRAYATRRQLEKAQNDRATLGELFGGSL